MKRNFFFLLVFIGLLTNVYGQNHWYKAQLHCHSTNSDGNVSPREVAQTYYNNGNRVVFITDHNVMTVSDTINIPGMLCINGQETHPGGVHFNGLFLQKTVNGNSYTCQQVIDSIHAQGALAQLNHPVDPDFRITFSQIMALQSIDLMEICNFPVNILYGDEQKLWDSILTAGKKIYGTATDDEHDINISDDGYIYIYADTLTREAIYNSLKQGSFYASTGGVLSQYSVDSNIIQISCANCTTIKFYGPNHTVLKSTRGKTSSYTITDELYVRAYFEDEGELDQKKCAWMQPIFHNELGVKSFKNDISAAIYPNPAVNNPVLKFNLPGSKAKITLFDITGHQVKEIPTDQITHGYNEVIIDTEGLTGGLYICVLATDQVIISRKMLLNK